MASTDELVKRAQKRGINVTEAEDGSWHGSYVWNGQDYGLDADTLEGLVDDMEALVECFSQDDTYSLDYNEDLDRYIIAVEGSDETYSNQNLAKAFAEAKNAVMTRLSKAEEERKAREAANRKLEKEAEEAKVAEAPSKAKRSNGGSKQPATANPLDLPKPVTDALVALLNALREAVTPSAGQTLETPTEHPAEADTLEAFVAPQPTPPKKRGLKKG